MDWLKLNAPWIIGELLTALAILIHLRDQINNNTLVLTRELVPERGGLRDDHDALLGRFEEHMRHSQEGLERLTRLEQDTRFAQTLLTDVKEEARREKAEILTAIADLGGRIEASVNQRFQQNEREIDALRTRTNDLSELGAANQARILNLEQRKR